MKDKLRVILCIVVMMTIVIGCTRREPLSIKIAEQYGLAYAPLQVMREKGFLEEALPGIEIKWEKLGNTAAIREAMLAGKVDVGFMGIPPFLIGVDKGMDWRIVQGLSSAPLGLVTNRKEIKTLEDITTQHRIALPQPGSIQHILLSMAAEKQLGDATKFDDQLVTLKHPDGVIALEAGTEISAHFTSPPFLFQELESEKNHLVVTGEEAVGGQFTFIVGVATEAFHSGTQIYHGFTDALEKSINFMNENPDETVELLASIYDMDKEMLDSYLHYEGMSYSSDLHGVEEFIEFMYGQGYLEETYTLEDVLW